MLGSPCSPCCASCTPAQVAGILNVFRAGSCSLSWEGSGIRYQEAASSGLRLTATQDWQAYIWKQQQPPPSNIELALNLAYQSSSSVQFIAYGIEWKATATFGIGGTGPRWPGTSCSVFGSAQLEMNGINNWDIAQTPVYLDTPFVWQIDKAYSPTLRPVSLGQYFLVPEDLSSNVYLTYPTERPSTWPSSLDWSQTTCNSQVVTSRGWYSCISYGGMGGITYAPSVSSGGVSFSTTMIAGALLPPRRWQDGNYPSPSQQDYTEYTGRITSIGATLTLP